MLAGLKGGRSRGVFVASEPCALSEMDFGRNILIAQEINQSSAGPGNSNN
jgi:hypothetical protein